MLKDIGSLQPSAAKIPPPLRYRGFVAAVRPVLGSAQFRFAIRFRRYLLGSEIAGSCRTSQGLNAGDFFEITSDRSTRALPGNDRLWDDSSPISQQVSP